jgi:hypothetical protein
MVTTAMEKIERIQKTLLLLKKKKTLAGIDDGRPSP